MSTMKYAIYAKVLYQSPGDGKNLANYGASASCKSLVVRKFKGTPNTIDVKCIGAVTFHMLFF